MITLIKDTVYSLNGSSRNSVSVNPMSIDLNYYYLSQLSFLNHSGVLIELEQTKKSWSPCVTFGLRILKGNLIAFSLIGTDESLRKIDFFG